MQVRCASRAYRAERWVVFLWAEEDGVRRGRAEYGRAGQGKEGQVYSREQRRPVKSMAEQGRTGHDDIREGRAVKRRAG